MLEKGLPSKLWSLAKHIFRELSEYRDSGKAVKTGRLYIKRKVERFDYEEGNVSCQWSDDYIVKEEWALEDRFDFTQRVKEELPDYAELVSGISRRYKVNESQAGHWLGRFVRILIGRDFDGMTDEMLVDSVTTFIGDLDKSPIHWDLQIWIEGVWLEEDEYEIYEGLRIRRPTASDVEVERPFDMPDPFRPHPLGQVSSAVLELTLRSRGQKETQDEQEILLVCLRLFRLGSVFSIRTVMHPKSFLAHRGTMFSSARFHSTYKYPITEQDIPELRDLIERIRSLSPKETLLATSGELTPVAIAYQRYNDALLRPQVIEARIASAIICLEALYLKAKERMELSRRLGERASVVLGLFDFRALEVYNVIKRAYEIRSTFIHGSQVKSDERRNASELAEKIMEYARMSLLVFLQLGSVVDKEKFINKIDNALLDENAHSKLTDLVIENCIVYR